MKLSVILTLTCATFFADGANLSFVSREEQDARAKAYLSENKFEEAWIPGSMLYLSMLPVSYACSDFIVGLVAGPHDVYRDGTDWNLMRIDGERHMRWLDLPSPQFGFYIRPEFLFLVREEKSVFLAGLRCIQSRTNDDARNCVKRRELHCLSLSSEGLPSIAVLTNAFEELFRNPRIRSVDRLEADIYTVPDGVYSPCSRSVSNRSSFMTDGRLSGLSSEEMKKAADTHRHAIKKFLHADRKIMVYGVFADADGDSVHDAYLTTDHEKGANGCFLWTLYRHENGLWKRLEKALVRQSENELWIAESQVEASMDDFFFVRRLHRHSGVLVLRNKEGGISHSSYLRHMSGYRRKCRILPDGILDFSEWATKESPAVRDLSDLFEHADFIRIERLVYASFPDD